MCTIFQREICTQAKPDITFQKKKPFEEIVFLHVWTKYLNKIQIKKDSLNIHGLKNETTKTVIIIYNYFIFNILQEIKADFMCIIILIFIV